MQDPTKTQLALSSKTTNYVSTSKGMETWQCSNFLSPSASDMGLSRICLLCAPLPVMNIVSSPICKDHLTDRTITSVSGEHMWINDALHSLASQACKMILVSASWLLQMSWTSVWVALNWVPLAPRCVSHSGLVMTIFCKIYQVKFLCFYVTRLVHCHSCEFVYSLRNTSLTSK